MENQNMTRIENGNVAVLESLISEIKGILSECEERVAEVWKERDADLAEAVSQADWEKNVDLIMSYDCIRSKKPFVRRFMGGVNVDVGSFYGQLKKLGPMAFTKIDKDDMDAMFLDKAKAAREANYQTFFNGYSVDAYGIENSMGLIDDGENTYYAYLPIMSNHLMSSQADLVGAMEAAKVHFSSRYIPKEFEYFGWYKLTENTQKKYKHEPAYYEEKVNEVRAGYKGRVEEKVAAMIQAYDDIKNRFPLGENLGALLERDIRTIPEVIAFGSCGISTGEETARIPQLRSFPLTGSMWFREKDIPLLHALYLRLLCSLPVGKIQFTVYDPKGLGGNVNAFNELFSESEIFPAKKVIAVKEELEKALKEALEYVRDIRQEIFDRESPDWVSYNRKMNKENTKKLLPYKVFTFFDIPTGMGTETLEMLENLIRHSKDCGFLVLFSFEEKPEGVTESKWKAVEECVRLSRCLSEEMGGPDERMQSLKGSAGYPIEFVGETILDRGELERMLERYVKMLNEKTKEVTHDFKEMMHPDNLFEGNSRDGLVFTIGYADKSDEEILLKVGDETPHYLIGGTTGSGKSNLLHNLIMSACIRYSPEELQVYLMDFKEGVEFSIYANKDYTLPHAKLVATEADTEYGVNVLAHLIEEKERRYKCFKKAGCKDIAAYRGMNSNEPMPRILAVVDEFQVLFGNADRAKTIENLAMLAKQGRACGIHLVMSTQTLSGLEFGSLESQFSGRIVLKCNAEDSKRLLGGISSNNEAATDLRIPYAIVNTAQGNVSGNIKISVPYAAPMMIKEMLSLICSDPQGQPLEKTVVFEGQTLPKHPNQDAFTTKKAEVCLGRKMSFDAGSFAIALQAKEAENILGVVSDDVIRRSLIKSMVLSALGSEAFDEFVYIGTDEEVLDWDEEDGMLFFRNVPGFLEYAEEELFDSKRLVVFDNYNLSREEGAAIGYGALPTGTAKIITDYIKGASSNGSHCVALYSRITNMKNSTMPLTEFEHRIGYGLNEDDARTLVGNMSFGRNDRTKERCFYAENGSITGWFQPFVTPEEEE